MDNNTVIALLFLGVGVFVVSLLDRRHKQNKAKKRKNSKVYDSNSANDFISSLPKSESYDSLSDGERAMVHLALDYFDDEAIAKAFIREIFVPILTSEKNNGVDRRVMLYITHISTVHNIVQIDFTYDETDYFLYFHVGFGGGLITIKGRDKNNNEAEIATIYKEAEYYEEMILNAIGYYDTRKKLINSTTVDIVEGGVKQ